MEGDRNVFFQLHVPLISIHTLRVEGDIFRLFVPSKLRISIHTLRVEGDAEGVENAAFRGISIHTLRVEGDKALGYGYVVAYKFQSTPSAWRVTLWPKACGTHSVDFNPHPPRGG